MTRSFSVRRTVAVAAVAAVAMVRAVTAEEMETAVDAVTSVWDGVYTEAQAKRGEAAYLGPCGKCHGWKLDGAPDDPDMPSTRPVAGAKFLRDWEGRSLAVLLEYTRATMPENNPGFLSDAEYADIVAYMLFASGLPPGSSELEAGPQRLSRVLISQRP
jgi:quinoprotein glucose dehydrogenase